jgi:TolA-binding protein
LGTACVTGRGGSLAATASRDWGETLTQAEAAANDHRYADADRLLADYATRYPGTSGATESAYWRGVIALEPANRDASPQVAVALFETYGKANAPLPHRLEADILRHLALRLQSSSITTVASGVPAAAVATGASSAAAGDLKAKDTEIQRLKDELAKANDELERIKRRLTTPTKP